MLLTEEEAKTKWCPQARSGEPDEGSGWNRYKDLGCQCIASACMAWRSVDAHKSKRTGNVYPNTPGLREGPCVGYCGLAGKVE